ncbi:hypothetical protein LTR84_001894 [Exophiala bonariae]|uniref:Threonine/serine exporter-like N-terminal domain-containing protein n=1 Tax=Exophiala bonariae TaxID=1690606 RepID=A0AAV9NGD8_9EURO|nr:hypothetical protein LTR84_001894 [Exophiala bonariae]
MSGTTTDANSNRVPDDSTQTPREAQDVAITDANIGSSGRPGIRTGKGGPKQSQKVKFSVDGGEGSNEQYDTRPRDTLGHPIPEIRVPISEDVADHTLTPPDWEGRTNAAAAHALTRASRLANRLSTPGTTMVPSGSSTPIYNPHRGNADYASPDTSPKTKPLNDWPINIGDIPMTTLDREKRPYSFHDDTTDDDTEVDEPKPLKRENENFEEARRIYRTLTSGHNLSQLQEHSRYVRRADRDGLAAAIQHISLMNPRLTYYRSGTATPAIDKRLHDVDYVPVPDEYRPGIFGAILSSKLANLQRHENLLPLYHEDAPSQGQNKTHHKESYSKAHSRSNSETLNSSGQSSGRATPSKRPKWYDSDNQSTGSMATLLAQASIASTAAAAPGTSGYVPRPHLPRAKSSSSMIATAVDMIKHPGNHFHIKLEQIKQAEEEERVIQDVAEIIACRKYLKKLARSLMAVGAPSHRLEEYMKTSSRALNIDGDFLYLPGSMLVSINDKLTMSTEVTLVRESQSVDLGKFKDVFEIYKCVIHGKYTAQEGTDELETIMKKPQRHSEMLRIFAYGVAAVAVGPFAFASRPVDFGPSFILGCVLGFLQLVVVTRSQQFSHVFEVLATVIIAFVARGLGSIYHNGTPVFCFSAIAQSSIALILPGYTVLCAALELQSKNMVAGSVRMVYAIIYSLFLGFGILIGSVIMGLIYPGAQSDVTCDIPAWWNTDNLDFRLIYVKFIWVPIFAICLAIINQAKWRQVPVMTLIAFAGYQANFWVSTRIANNIQVSNAIGAFVIGCMANLYSRFFHGLAAAAMLPSIFVQVPSGLAASGSLVAGITSANQISGNATGVSIINNGTAGFLSAQDGGANTNVYSGTIFNVGYGMVQVAIGISVGLYLSALVVYPIGKRRSGLFSF